MSNGSPADTLVEEAIEAIKAGDKALARGKLETAVKIDDHNEKAWYYLAAVATNDKDRRAYLGNVVLINPGNKRAQELLDKLDVRQEAKEARVASRIMGMERKQAYILLAMFIGLIVVAIAMLVLLGGGGGEQAPTIIVPDTATPTPDVNATGTAQASITPTITLTPTRTPGVPPTWTPLPEPTDLPPTQAPIVLPPPPSDIGGRIVMQSGRGNGPDDGTGLVLTYPADLSMGEPLTSSGLRGLNPVLEPGGDRVAWAQYASSSRSFVLQIQTLGEPTVLNVSTIYDNEPLLLSPNEPAWSGDSLAFTAQAADAEVRDLWLLDISGAAAVANSTSSSMPPTPTPEGAVEQPTEVPAPAVSVVRLTQGSANVSFPVFNPSGTALLFASEGEEGTDLHSVNIESQEIFPVTSDGDALIEAAPDWGTYNGAQEIIFSGSADGGTTTDIYIMPVDGSSPPQVLLDLGDQDIRPRFSPNGRYILFSSTRNGSWDVFMYDRESGDYYSVEGDPLTVDVANDWTN